MPKTQNYIFAKISRNYSLINEGFSQDIEGFGKSIVSSCCTENHTPYNVTIMKVQHNIKYLLQNDILV